MFTYEFTKVQKGNIWYDINLVNVFLYTMIWIE